MNKKKALQAFIEISGEELDTMFRAAHHARESAICDEVKTQEKYDTQSTELSYLAGAQAQRAQELQAAFRFLKNLKKTLDDVASRDAPSRIVEGCIVSLKNLKTGSVSHLMLLPQDGGVKVEIDGQRIISLATTSPLGEELLGRCAGETFDCEINDRVFEYEVLSFV